MNLSDCLGQHPSRATVPHHFPQLLYGPSPFPPVTPPSTFSTAVPLLLLFPPPHTLKSYPSPDRPPSSRTSFGLWLFVTMTSLLSFPLSSEESAHSFSFPFIFVLLGKTSVDKPIFCRVNQIVESLTVDREV